MRPLQSNFQQGAPVSQVPSGWFNTVAKFINSLIPGRGISWAKGEETNIIEVDPKYIEEIIAKQDEAATTTSLPSGATSGSAVSGSDTFTANAGTICTVYVLTHAHTNSDATATLHFRPMTISPSGKVLSIGAESGQVTVYVAS